MTSFMLRKGSRKARQGYFRFAHEVGANFDLILRAMTLEPTWTKLLASTLIAHNTARDVQSDKTYTPPLHLEIKGDVELKS